LRMLLPAEKLIYEHWLKEIVKPKKVDIKPMKAPKDFEPKYVWRCKTNLDRKEFVRIK